LNLSWPVYPRLETASKQHVEAPEASAASQGDHGGKKMTTGWWFGTWLLFFHIYIYIKNYIYIDIGNFMEFHHPN
jgi:hypothetical protein